MEVPNISPSPAARNGKGTHDGGEGGNAEGKGGEGQKSQRI
jgi:hypothetical protein